MATAGEESQNNEDTAADSEDNLASPHCVTPTIPGDTALECYNMAAKNPTRLKCLVDDQPSIVDDVDDNDRSALMHAVLHGDLTSLKKIIELGWSVNRRDDEGKTPLAIACYQGWYEGVVYLLNNRADQMIGDYKNRLPIHAATHNPKIRCLALLVQHLQLRELSSTDDEMMTALHWAAFHDRPEHVQLLVSKNVNMFAIDIDGKTPLHWAAQNGNELCVEILLRESRGSNLVNEKDNSGKGALHYASAAGHLDTMRCIATSKNCNIHLADPDDRQALHWAAAMGRASCVDLLLKLGADPSMHDLETKNALHYAKQASHDESAKVLNDAIKELQIEKRNKMREMAQTMNGYHKPSSGNKRATDNKKSLAENGSHHTINGVELPSPRHDHDKKLNSPSNNTSPLNTDTKNSPAKEKSPVKNKLPPIRGSIIHNKVQALYHGKDDETIVSQETETSIFTNNHNKASEKTSQAGSKFSVREEKPSNRAMQFTPTVGLYKDNDG